MARRGDLSQKATQELGLPEGIKFFGVAPFAGMNVKDAPTAIQDNEFVYLENFVKIGEGFLRTVWDVGSALYTAPSGKTIVYYSFFTISTNYYCFIVLSDGSAVQINTQTGVSTSIGSGFYNAATGFVPCARQWGSTYLLISNRNTPNDYWAWDGSILYTAGGAAPNGINLIGSGYSYGSAPTITTFGGAGSGMTFSAIIQAGSITNLQITNPGSGYAPGDIVQLQFTGGGSDTSGELKAIMSPVGIGGVNIVAGGSGYAAPPTVTFTGGGGSGAAGTAVVVGGAVTAVTVTNAGANYTAPPTIGFVGGGGSGAGATATLTGVVSSIVVTNQGGGVTQPVTVALTGGGGSGATAVAVLTPKGSGSFYVSGVTVTNAGSGYTSPPSVQFNYEFGSGSPPAATAVVSQGVSSVAVSPGGSGYAQPPTVAFSGGGGTLAAGTAVVSNGVVSIGVTAGGSGYTTPPGVVFSGGSGSGATARAIIQNGVVTTIQITNAGINYVTPPTVGFTGGGGGSGAAAIASISGTVVAVDMTATGSGYTTLPTVTITGGAGSGAYGVAVMQPTYVATISIVNGGTGYAVNPLPTPTLTVVGGGGSGATATATVTSGAITSVSVGGSGGKLYTSPPAVEISPGANNSAYATVNLMPYGVSGGALEMFGSHVWVFNPAAAYGATIPPGPQYAYSAPNSIWDFATSDGGGDAQSTDAFLQTQYVNARQSAGYLYTFGDGSVSAISNLQTTTSSSSPAATTAYTYQNVDPTVGLSWRDALQEYGRTLIAANETGVFGLYGGTMAKASEKLEQLLNYQGASNVNVMKAVYPAEGGVTPSSASAHIFNVRYYLNLITIFDPSIGGQRNVMVAWNEKDWCVLSQSVSLTSIATQKVQSFYYAYGSDGNSIYPLFNQPSTNLTKKLTTKYFGVDRAYVQKEALGVWLVAQDTSKTQVGISATVNLQVSGIAPLLGPVQPELGPFAAGLYAALVQQPGFTTPTPAWGLWGTSAENIAFTTLGVTLTTTTSDFILADLAVGYRDVVAYYS